MGQLSFFSAEARPPCVADLAGLLCGPGRAVGFARGRAARISVHLDERWRGLALVAALAERGVQARLAVVERPAEPADPLVDRHQEDTPADIPAAADDDFAVDEEPDETAPDGVVFGRGGAGAEPVERAEPDETASDLGKAEADEPGGAGGPGRRATLPVVGGELEVATAFRTDLTGLANQWLAGDGKVVPPDFTLHGGVLRLWALASGRWAESGYVLGLDPSSPATHEPLQKALAASGLPATLLKTGGPALRVVGRRRLERLAELVGRAPRGVVERTWPAA
ncbi:hypothetical protein ACQPZF_01725 [Actinosynnema sp. CS-041913]|uniref:hypothetical protein n=1 Tax=Actinosynnema sp. CS-041913 TaxID=3239917 RepID=UPI003D8DB626